MSQTKIRRKDKDTILQALRAGVVPKVGLQHIQVGRVREIEEIVRDIERATDGGAAIRFIIGDYGSGKTFFLNLVRLIALEKGMVTMSADLAPDRRLHATAGQARLLFAEMTRNLSTRTKPDGGALGSIVERFITQAIGAAEETGTDTSDVIRAKLSRLQEMVGGYDFASVIDAYWRGHDSDDEQLKANALRWLRAEFATRTDARAALKVRTIIDDTSIYDHLKLFSRFVQEAGYKGLFISLDEMVNLYKLANSQARNSNYEQILRILNDVLQGTSSHIGILLGGTPEFLLDTRRGLYSYQALQSRLTENTFAKDGLVDLSGPVIRLQKLTPEDMYVLLVNIRRVFLSGEDGKSDIPDDALKAFMAHCAEQIGDAYFRTPRNTVTAFINLLAVIEQNPTTDWRSLLGNISIGEDKGDDPGDIVDYDHDPAPAAAGNSSDELSSFKL